MATDTDRPCLLEREAELEALGALLDAAAAGSGRLVLLEGPAGTGKSELLQSARRRASEAGFGVLTARGGELERDVPFGVALELFAGRLQTLEPSSRKKMFQGAAELAAPLFTAAPPADWAQDDTHFPVVHGLYWLLVNLGERSPLLVVVDDAHWADRQSLHFLLYLAQRLDGLPVALVVALREDEAPAGGKPMARLRAVPEARVVRPEPLSKDAVATLIRDVYFPTADDGFCRAVFDVSVGNPYVVREVLSVVDLEGMPPTEDSADPVRRLAPESVVRSTRARLSRLPQEAWKLAQAVAVLGPDAHTHYAARLAGLDHAVAAATAHDLVSAGVFRRGEPLDFVQLPVQSAVYSSIHPGPRAAAHAAAAAILADEDVHPERLATHLVHTPPRGDPSVVDHLWSAARWASGVGAPDAAVRFLRRALDEPPPPDARAEILIELGRAGAAAGDPSAVDHLQEAVGLLDPGPRRTEAIYDVGYALMHRGRFPEAREALRRGLEELGDAPSERRPQLLAALLKVSRLEPSRAPDELMAAAEAAAVPDGDGSPGQRALLAGIALERLLAGGRCDEVVAVAREALAGAGPVRAESMAELLLDAVAALTWSGELESAEEALLPALESAERSGLVMLLGTAAFRRSIVAYRRGALADAACEAQRALDAARFGWVAYLPAARGVLAVTLTELNELPRAAAILDAAESPASGPFSWPEAVLRHARGHLYLVEGAAAEAAEEARTAGGIMTGDLGSETAAIVPWRSLAAEALARFGERAEARRLAAEEVELGRSFGASRSLGIALRVLGVVEGGARGRELLREATAVLAASPARLEESRALKDLGAALRRSGRRAEARTVLEKGLRLAERCGGVLLVGQLGEELEASGARPGRQGRVGRAALTPGEQRVARLAADGLTNRQIAEKLFVSGRAVEFHLGNTYAKLGVSSRRELAAALGD